MAGKHVAVFGDSFIEQVLVPPPSKAPNSPTTLLRVANGASLIASMLRATSNFEIDTAEIIERDVQELQPALIVDLEARKIRNDKCVEEIIGFKAMRVCAVTKPFASTLQLPNTAVSPKFVVFCDAPRLHDYMPSGQVSLSAYQTVILLSHHPDTIQNRLLELSAERTIMVIHANSLRDNSSLCQLGTLSCEQAAADLNAALTSDSTKSTSILWKLSTLADHLIIALNSSAVIYCHFTKGKDDTTYKHTLFLAYQPKHGYDIAPNLWTDIGFSSILTVGISQYIFDNSSPASSLDPPTIIKAIRHGVAYCLRHRKHGYDVDDALKQPNGGMARDTWCNGIFVKPVGKAELADITSLQLSFPDQNSRPGEWTILGQMCGLHRPVSPDENNKNAENIRAILERSRRRSLKLARRVILSGLEKAGTRLSFPHYKIGDLEAVDRWEIEGFQSAKGLIERYLIHPGDRPLCLAVFGPPGSGKSFGMKQIAKSLAEQNERIDKNALEVNLSGFSNISGLAHALHEARDRALTQHTPVVLIDEFDCAFEQRPLGWLKYLLAPMQDGTFLEGNSIYHVGPAILVFIGGTRRTFDEFAGQMRNRDFIDAKGPDFVSRLRGHVDVRGINQLDESDHLYVVRRAVALRYFLGKKLGKDFNDHDVDKSLLHTLLTVKRYHHGVRSLEQIIEMCDTQSPRRQLTRTSLPPHNQLDMHVDAAEFRKILDVQV